MLCIRFPMLNSTRAISVAACSFLSSCSAEFKVLCSPIPSKYLPLPWRYLSDHRRQSN
ncbi:hypothetical protein V9T40_009526 [Parthenolecanium corni]|uniref:Uncharacterized protein n=1 Tax=Parthenolecanium corni TaxID=536013 RepID=A0AAN9TMX7_9HEMI